MIHLDTIRKPVFKDLSNVDRLIQQRLHSEIPLINQLTQHIIASGGKRLRPLLTLLAARAIGQLDAVSIHLATIIEFVHTATLLHDDVVDASELRRGQETANSIWGNQASVLVGDFLYSRAFQMMVELDNLKIMQLLSTATNTIAEGEVMQLMLQHDPDTSEAHYMQVIYCKTAALFEVAAQLGAAVIKQPELKLNALADYGRYLGIAYQLIDDILDYKASATEMGKNPGDDLAEGKPTLPLLYALQRGSAAQQKLIKTAVREGLANCLPEIIVAIESSGAIDYTYSLAKQYAQQASHALLALPDSDYREALKDLTQFVVERSY